MTQRSIPSLLGVVGAVLLAGGCKSAGMGTETRTDIASQMQAAQGPIQDCYAAALKSNRKIKGMMTLEFVAEASTGQFKNIIVRRDETNDPALRQCVLGEVGKLKLAKATSSNLQINYPLRFAPNH